MQNWVVAVESDESLTSTYISLVLSFVFVCSKRRYNTRKTPPNNCFFDEMVQFENRETRSKRIASSLCSGGRRIPVLFYYLPLSLILLDTRPFIHMALSFALASSLFFMFSFTSLLRMVFTPPVFGLCLPLLAFSLILISVVVGLLCACFKRRNSNQIKVSWAVYFYCLFVHSVCSKLAKILLRERADETIVTATQAC